MSKRFIPRWRWIIGLASVAALLLTTAAVAQFRVFQLTLPSNATRQALEAAAAAIAAGNSTASISKVPRQTVGQRAAELAAKCPSPLPSRLDLRRLLTGVVTANKQGRLRANGPSAGSGGLDTDMWSVVVNRKGEICAVMYSGSGVLADQQEWLGSRVIAAQKANTANSFSLPGFALSSANLFFATQNGQSLYGLQHSNPVDPAVAYAGTSDDYATENDALLGKKVGGINVFGGGLALYTSSTPPTLIGAIGVSGDTSCADHIAAWKMRWSMNLDNVPNGPFNRFAALNPNVKNGRDLNPGASSDNMIVTTSNSNTLGQDIVPDSTAVGGMRSDSGFGHATCGGDYSYTANGTLVSAFHSTSTIVINSLPTAFPIGPNP